MKSIIQISIFTISLLVAGCANQATVENSSGGTTKVFERPYDDVRPATLETIQGLNVNIKKTKPEGNGTRIIFSKSISAFSWGEVGSVSVKPLDKTTTSVTVDSEKRFGMGGTDEKEFSQVIFSGIEETLIRNASK